MPVLIPALLSSIITTALLIVVATVPSWPMLLGTRFLGGYGLVQIGFHAFYSFVLTALTFAPLDLSPIQLEKFILLKLRLVKAAMVADLVRQNVNMEHSHPTN